MKRHTLFDQLHRKRHVHIFLLQETHSVDDAGVRQWAREAGYGAWRGPQFWHHGSSSFCGVAVLICDSAAVSNVRIGYKNTHGRILKVDVTYAGQPLAVVNVYAPCQAADRPAFFSNELPKTAQGGGLLLMAGDFNCILRTEDARGTAAGSHRFIGRDQLEAFMLMEGLEDSWLISRPDLPRQPWKGTFSTNVRLGPGQPLTYTSARLDRWLTPTDLREWVSSTSIRPLRDDYLPGDHGAVILKLSPPHQPPRGPGVWSCPLHVLNDTAYIQDVKACIARFQQQHPALGARDMWEGVKLAIADFTQAFCLSAAWRKRQPEILLRRTAALAAAVCAQRPTDCSVAAAQLRDAKAKLGILHAKAAAAAQQAEDVLWQDYGEQSTYWFQHLARVGRPQEQLMAVAATNGMVHSFAGPDVTERDAAAECLAAFFEGLYTPVPVNVAAQATLLAATPQRLTPQAIKDAEGPEGESAITAECLIAAIAGAPRGRRPGSDGLPYEFYAALKHVVVPLLVAAFAETFEDTGAPCPLSASQHLGLITLIHKGDGKPRNSCDSYRPITLLNCDYKIAARVLATRMASAVNDVLSVTQTAFVPGRDIADNVLFHLEEIDWLETPPPVPLAPHQGCIVFLDFEKAYDRANRAWLMQCLQHFGFGPGVRRWVQVLLAGTGAHVMFNGHRTRRFDITSGMAQGSPLSPLLFNLQAQPLASYLQHLQARGSLRPILLPDASPAPPSQQHADDTTLHLHSLADLPIATQAVAPYGAASGAWLNMSKSKGLLLGSHPDVLPPTGVDPVTGIRFLPPGLHLRHLGILMARPVDQPAAALAMHALRLTAIRAAVRQWSPFNLSFAGRLHVAKQCMASIIYYHGQFVRPAPSQLHDMVSILTSFMARPAGAVTDDHGAHMMHPSLAVASLPRIDGGYAAVDIPVQLDALQAKIVARLFHPRHHPWKGLMLAALNAAAPAHLGMALPFYVAAPLLRHACHRTGRAALTPRLADYLHSMRRMSPHRASPAAAMDYYHILVEPILHNACIRLPTCGSILTPDTAPSPLLAALQYHGVRRLRDLRTALQAQPPPADLLPILALLPPAWQGAVQRPQPPRPAYYSSADGSFVSSTLNFVDPSCRLRAVLPDGRLSRDPLQHPPTPASLSALTWYPCHVIRVARPVDLMSLQERRSYLEQIRLGAPREAIVVAIEHYFVGRWDQLDISPSMWAVGVGRPIFHFVVRLAALRARRIRAAAVVSGFMPGRAIFPKAWQSMAGAADGIVGVEQRWVDTVVSRAGPSVTVDPGDAGPSDPAVALAARRRRQFASGWAPPPWLRLGPRLDADPPAIAVVAASDLLEDSIARRVRRRHSGAAVAQPLPPPGTLAPPPGPPPDHVDVADPPIGQSGGAAKLVWCRLMLKYLPREACALAWRLLHVSLSTGVFWAYTTGRSIAHATCSSMSCGAGAPETIQHLFLTCPDVAPAADWLLRLWAAIVGPTAPPPPCSAAVLLADDHRIWQPTGGEHGYNLWTALRLSWLSAVWALRCKRRADPASFPVTAIGIVEATVAGVCCMIRRDYTRTISDVRTLTPSPTDWFRGRDTPSLSTEDFISRWGLNGVLCSLTPTTTTTAGGHLLLHFTAHHPVSLPHPPTPRPPALALQSALAETQPASPGSSI